MSRNLNFSTVHKSLSSDKDLMMIKGLVINKNYDNLGNDQTVQQS